MYSKLSDALSTEINTGPYPYMLERINRYERTGLCKYVQVI